VTSWRRWQALLPPIIGALFLVLWLVAEAGRLHGPGFYAVLVGYTLTIMVARMAPIVTVVGWVAIPSLQGFGLLPRFESTTWPILLAPVIGAFFVAMYAKSATRWAALGVGIAASILSVALIVIPDATNPYMWSSWLGNATAAESPETLALLVFFGSLAAGSLFTVAWLVGLAARLNLKRLQAWLVLRETDRELHRASDELARTAERERIAQEVHDVLAHSLAVIATVADGARFLRQTKPEEADDAFELIARTARESLLDVKALIDALRDPTDSSTPGLADIDALLARIRTTGLSVEFIETGTPVDVPPDGSLAVYRIVQEGLSNVLRHAGAEPHVRLRFDWDAPGLTLTIASRSDSAGSSEFVDGNGIRGMRDRARLAGGWLTAGWSGDEPEEFLVTAFLPITATAEAASDPPDAAS
jgi:signal transduction histidine kinase